MESRSQIVFFDGECNLCNGFVNFLISRDKKRQFSVASLQGQTAQKLLSSKEIEECSSIIYYDSKGKKNYQSTAVIKILADLGGLYWVLSWLRVLPRFFRDWVYNLVAENRYRFFGRKSVCRMPTQEEKTYFLD